MILDCLGGTTVTSRVLTAERGAESGVRKGAWRGSRALRSLAKGAPATASARAEGPRGQGRGASPQAGGGKTRALPDSRMRNVLL